MANASNNHSSVATKRDPYELMQIFEGAEDLPTLPEVAVRLQQVVDDPKSDARDVAKIIADDPAIATKVLKVVNSVFYSPRRGAEITDLQPAVARLGFLTVTNIALSTSVFQAFGHGMNLGLVDTGFAQQHLPQAIGAKHFPGLNLAPLSQLEGVFLRHAYQSLFNQVPAQRPEFFQPQPG